MIGAMSDPWGTPWCNWSQWRWDTRVLVQPVCNNGWKATNLIVNEIWVGAASFELWQDNSQALLQPQWVQYHYGTVYLKERAVSFRTSKGFKITWNFNLAWAANLSQWSFTYMYFSVRPICCVCVYIYIYSPLPERPYLSSNSTNLIQSPIFPYDNVLEGKFDIFRSNH